MKTTVLWNDEDVDVEISIEDYSYSMEHETRWQPGGEWIEDISIEVVQIDTDEILPIKFYDLPQRDQERILERISIDENERRNCGDYRD